MTKKQMRKFAEEIYNCEQIHQDKNASKEAKTKAENRIMSITTQIMSETNGLAILAEIDELVQQKYF